jgi:hypothetical protein
MGSLTWHGWQTSLENAHGTTEIIYGGNLRKRPKDDTQKETHVPRHKNQPVSPSRKPETDIQAAVDQCAMDLLTSL